MALQESRWPREGEICRANGQLNVIIALFSEMSDADESAQIELPSTAAIRVAHQLQYKQLGQPKKRVLPARLFKQGEASVDVEALIKALPRRATAPADLPTIAANSDDPAKSSSRLLKARAASPPLPEATVSNPSAVSIKRKRGRLSKTAEVTRVRLAAKRLPKHAE